MIKQLTELRDGKYIQTSIKVGKEGSILSKRSKAEKVIFFIAFLIFLLETVLEMPVFHNLKHLVWQCRIAPVIRRKTKCRVEMKMLWIKT